MPFTPTRDMLGSNPVNLLIRDALYPGDTAFDIGAYHGWLTALMGRLVGPAGTVVAFEPDPRSLEQWRASIHQAALSNCTLVHAAVCDKTGELDFFIHTNDAQNSTLTPVRPELHRTVRTSAIALDAYTNENALHPSLIKVDTERGELNVLRGGIEYIRRHRPDLILEQEPHDKSCAELLAAFGYVGIDAADYGLFSTQKYDPQIANTDVLYFVPGISRFRTEMFSSSRDTTIIDSPQVHRTDAGTMCEPIALDAGRYVMCIDYSPGPGNSRMQQRITGNGRVLAHSGGHKHWLWRCCRRMPFHLHVPTAISLEFVDVEPGATNGITPRTIQITHFPGLARSIKINEL